MEYANLLSRLSEKHHLYSTSLELTYQCNLDCFYCYNDLDIDGQPLTLEQYRRLFRDLRTLGTLFITLSGGEPLAHPDFFKIAAYARELGLLYG